MLWFAILNIDLAKYDLRKFLVLGIILALGYFGTIIFEKFKLPKVISFILIGFILGKSILDLIDYKLIDQFTIISFTALSFIGFTVGGELVYKRIKELGASIPVITILESFGAFLLVFGGVYLITKDSTEAMLLGALASATAPAATVGVLWQYNAKGPLTTTLYAVVGLDDASSLIIYAFASTFAINILSHTGSSSAASIIVKPLLEISGAVALGIISALLLHIIGKKMKKPENLLLITLAAILSCSGVAQTYGFSLILTNMILGVTLINLSPRNRKYFDVIHKFNPPFYTLFLILVGSRLDYTLIPQIGAVGIMYIITRMLGKSVGAWLGAVVTKAPDVVRKYLFFGLYSAAGVPVGLAIELADNVKKYGSQGVALSTVIITVVIATLFVFEVVGPLLAKHAIIQAGEVDKKYLDKA